MYTIKPCQANLFTGLDKYQWSYAMTYGYEGDDLNYRAFTVVMQLNPTDYPKTSTVTACCREHARDMSPGAISCSE